MKSGSLIIIVCAIFLISAWVLWDMHARRHGRLVSYSYKYGGDMKGGHSSVRIKKLDGLTAFMTYSNAEWHYQDPDVEEYHIPASVLGDIEKVYDEYSMYRFEWLPMSKIFVCDAGTGSWSFEFDDGKSSAFKDNKEIPLKGCEGLRKIEKIIADCRANADILPGLVRKSSENEDCYRKIEKGSIVFSVYEYSEGFLKFRFANGLDEDKSVRMDVSISRYGKDGPEEIFRSESKSVIQLTAGYTEESSISLEERRLKEGRYVLEISGYRTEFEIGINKKNKRL